MVFLPGEVTVDYELQLKVELDGSRLCVIGYSNDALCYIPSRRVLAEGGYEGGSAMVYYDRPAKFAPGIEDRIINARETISVNDNGVYENILLIDDAVGSGSTLNETAKQIRQTGICKGLIIRLALTGRCKGLEFNRCE